MNPPKESPEERPKYCQALEILNGHGVLVFTIRLQKDLYNPAIIPGPDGEAICAEIWPAVGDPPVYHIVRDEEHAHRVMTMSNHPWNLLAHRINFKNSKFDADETVRSFLSRGVGAVVRDQQLRAQAIRGFLQGLEQLRGHDHVQVVFSDQPNDRAHRISDGQSLFRIVWVFRWAAHMLANHPNNLQADGTWRIGRQYPTMVLSVGYGNEGLPIGFCMAPSESFESYWALYEEVKVVLRACGEPETLLTELQLLSDQGAALSAYAHDADLHWRLCHCHLIRAAGTKTRMASCIRRLLKCCSDEQFEAVKRDIEMEIEKHYIRPKRPFPKHYNVLDMMLNPEKADWPYHPEHWRRDLRPGCPTTTASEESINRQLNSALGASRAFIKGLKALLTYCRCRFRERNYKVRREHRASNLFLNKLKGPNGERLRQNQAKVDYLTAVNSLVGRELTRDWEYPELTGDLPKFPRTEPIFSKNQFPPGWIPTQRGPECGPVDSGSTECEGEEKEDKSHKVMSPPEGGPETQSTKNYHRDLIRDIIHEIRNMLPTATWNRQHETIISHVHTLVRDSVKTPPDQPIDTEVAVMCRLQCYEDAGVPEDAEEKAVDADKAMETQKRG
jgi:hypothetical protein